MFFSEEEAEGGGRVTAEEVEEDSAGEGGVAPMFAGVAVASGGAGAGRGAATGHGVFLRGLRGGDEAMIGRMFAIGQGAMA
ncbi:MAG: hypothetical protein HY687_02505 [Chloroflexi bacterium]|nr:hypothetical protein [Chloroflexota bacterium]